MPESVWVRVGEFTVLSYGTGGSRSPFAPSVPEATREVYVYTSASKEGRRNAEGVADGDNIIDIPFCVFFAVIMK